MKRAASPRVCRCFANVVDAKLLLQSLHCESDNPREIRAGGAFSVFATAKLAGAAAPRLCCN